MDLTARVTLKPGDAEGPAADPEPRLLFVPVVACGPGIVTVCSGRLCSGERVGLGFTSQASFAAAYGPGHAQVRMRIQCLQDLLRPTGITTVLLDLSQAMSPAG